MRFSRRTPEDLAETPVFRRLRAVPDAIDLTMVDPTRSGLGLDGEALTGLLADPALATYAPDPAGLPAARAAVAGWAGVPADNVILTASTSEAYGLLFRVLCDPGDAVAVPAPSYPLFEHLARLEGCASVRYPLHYGAGRWRIDLDALASVVGDGSVRALITVSPNNPTGSILDGTERAAIATLCRDHQIPWISDEVFAPYRYPDTPRFEGATGPGCLRVVLDGLSKRCGMPQLKLAWIALHGALDGDDHDVDELRRRLCFAADAYLSTATPVQLAAGRLLEAGRAVTRRIAARVEGSREALRSALLEFPEVELLSADGGWYAVVRVPRVQSEEQWVLQLAERHGVIVQPGFFYDFEREAYLVLGLLSVDFDEGVRRLIAGIRAAL